MDACLKNNKANDDDSLSDPITEMNEGIDEPTGIWRDLEQDEDEHTKRILPWSELKSIETRR